MRVTTEKKVTEIIIYLNSKEAQLLKELFSNLSLNSIKDILYSKTYPYATQEVVEEIYRELDRIDLT